MPEEQTLYQAHPAMFRNHPFWFLLTALLCLAGIVLLVLIPWIGEVGFAGGGFIVVGLLILIPWWFRTRGIRLIVTNERTRLRRGILSKHTNSVFHDNVRNIQIRQSLIQRLMKVGYIGIASAGQAGMEIEVHGIPDPEKVKRLIDQHRRAPESTSPD